MYNDTIKVANKIISTEDLIDIFQKMNEEIITCEKKLKSEILQNEKYEMRYQTWSVKNYTGNINVDVKFYDDTSISFDKFNNFMSIFNSRLHEIKYFHLRYNCNYWIKHQGVDGEFISQHINMDVYETKMNIDIKLSSKDNIMNEVYDLIKNKILLAPEKYDRIIKNKVSITNKINFSLGFIPSIIISLMLVFIPFVRQIYGLTYIGFTILSLLLSYIIGSLIMGAKLDELYKSISPSKKYAGYDSFNSKSIYKDDIDKYIDTSEILIGKNVNNLKNRKEISELEKKYSKYIKYEIIILIVLSFVVLLISNIF